MGFSTSVPARVSMQLDKTADDYAIRTDQCLAWLDAIDYEYDSMGMFIYLQRLVLCISQMFCMY